MRNLKQSNSQQWKVEWWLPGPPGGGNRESLLSEYKVTVQQDENVPEICYTTDYLQLTIWCCAPENLLREQICYLMRERWGWGEEERAQNPDLVTLRQERGNQRQPKSSSILSQIMFYIQAKCLSLKRYSLIWGLTMTLTFTLVKICPNIQTFLVQAQYREKMVQAAEWLMGRTLRIKAPSASPQAISQFKKTLGPYSHQNTNVVLLGISNSPALMAAKRTTLSPQSLIPRKKGPH